MTEKVFVEGLLAKLPHNKAPDFVKLNLSIKRKELGNWLRSQTDDWINIDIKQAKSGKLYAEVNAWKPGKKEAPADQGVDDDFNDSIPFG